MRMFNSLALPEYAERMAYDSAIYEWIQQSHSRMRLCFSMLTMDTTNNPVGRLQTEFKACLGISVLPLKIDIRITWSLFKHR